MQSQARFLASRCGILLAVPIVFVLLLSGCGSSNNATNAAATTTAPTTAVSQKVQAYVEHRFGSEAWYSLIARIEVTGGSAIIGTRLVDTKTPGRNRKLAEKMCRAVLKAPRVSSVSVFYDEAGGGSTASC